MPLVVTIAETHHSDVEEDVEHITLVDSVRLTFLAQHALSAGFSYASAAGEIIKLDHLGADEAPLKV